MINNFDDDNIDLVLADDDLTELIGILTFAGEMYKYTSDEAIKKGETITATEAMTLANSCDHLITKLKEQIFIASGPSSGQIH